LIFVIRESAICNLMFEDGILDRKEKYAVCNLAKIFMPI
jgi:hypothetical protein